MLDVIGYWSVVSLMIAPLLAFPVIGFTWYVDYVLQKYAGWSHRLIWWEKLCDRDFTDLEISISIAGCAMAVIEGFALLITTIHYIVSDDKQHDYLVLIKWMGTTFGPTFGLVVAAIAVFIGFHLLLVGYAKCLSLNDKVKAKEKKDV
ncbi:hypothetical protein HWC29_gp088 [Aeromonas phage 4_4572]|nr:hypothetical protein HWC29_gp088 [Aeromonas phage 4_4572]QEG09098.1 hypothetical protein [Aeromonas phage 4_4572]